MRTFEKRRTHAPLGTIPDALDMFRSDVRFDEEIAPAAGLRVPVCFEATISDAGTVLRLEDLSAWTPGAEPAGVAVELRELHRRFEGDPRRRWPWLRPPGAAADLIGELYDRTWPTLASRTDLPADLRRLGASLVGQVAAAELLEGTAGPLTLCHGDTSDSNLATGPNGEIAFLDWEDVRCAAGVTDLAWFLVSSVDPHHWREIETIYGQRIDAVLPSVSAQAFFALADHADGSPEAEGWTTRLQAAADRLSSTPKSP